VKIEGAELLLQGIIRRSQGLLGNLIDEAAQLDTAIEHRGRTFEDIYTLKV
jgi:hypothetical protein